LDRKLVLKTLVAIRTRPPRFKEFIEAAAALALFLCVLDNTGEMGISRPLATARTVTPQRISPFVGSLFKAYPALYGVIAAFDNSSD
jgi:hypothetical protein